MPGERAIVCYEHGHNVILEGNRRVCACKLILDRSLIPKQVFSRFPTADKEIQDSIRHISVDLVPNREETKSTLYNRHLAGVKKWSPVSKQKFFANEFNNGRSIPYICEIAASSEGTVKKGIKEYNLTLLALSLDKWTKEQKSKLNLQNIKVSPYLRVFTSKSKIYDISGASLLQMSFNDNTLKPTSELEEKVFNHSIFLIAREAFFNNEFTTRNTIDDIPNLINFLKDNGVISTQSEDNPDDTENTNDSNDTNSNGDNENSSDKGNGQTNYRDSGQYGRNYNDSDNNSKSKDTSKSAKAPFFFHALTWHGLNPSNQDDIGIINLADEIKRISETNVYGKYPIATAMLLRALLEQSLKYYTKKIGKWDELLLFSKKNPGFDPMLGNIIKFYNSNKNYQTFFQERTVQSSFSCSTDITTLNYLDTNIHNTHYVKATKIELENLAAKGLFPLINYILNLT